MSNPEPTNAAPADRATRDPRLADAERSRDLFRVAHERLHRAILDHRAGLIMDAELHDEVSDPAYALSAGDFSEVAKWVFEFSVWPQENGHWEPSVFELFRMLHGRMEVEKTIPEFADYAESLARQGFTVREVTRRPYIEPVTVI